MPDVNESVANLQKAIQETDCPPEKRPILDGVSEHIESIKMEPDAGHHLTLRERLEMAIVEFDATHHELVESMREVILSLDVAGV